MKIILAQINTTVGAVVSNTRKMIEHIQQAEKTGADLIVFNELSITGYPPKDLLEKKYFIDDNLKMLDLLAKQSKKIGIVCGYVERNEKPSGKRLFNAAALLHDGKIVSKHFKSLLPTYDVFDEARYFEPAPSVKTTKFKGLNLGISICEDIWNDKDFFNPRLYHIDPIEQLAKKKADLLVSINSSPFSIEKRDLKNKMLRNTVIKHKIPLIYVNQVGGNDSLIFDGASIAYNAKAEIATRALDFQEDIVEFHTENQRGTIHEISKSNAEMVHKALVLGLQDYVKKCGFSKVVIGLSGGIDSAVTAVIAAKALGKENVMGVSMPSQYSSRESVEDAKALAENLGIKLETFPIMELYNLYLETFKDEFAGIQQDTTEENLQARIRANILMALSNKFGYLLLGTGNKSEMSVGYCTIYGDMAGGLAVLSDVPKTMVYKLAEFINKEKQIIPQCTVNKPPSAELKPDQKDSDSLPPYEILDPIIKAYVEESKGVNEIIELGFERQIVEEVIERIDKNEYKRQQAAPGLKVTSKAFGFGRRMPIACKIERPK